MVKSIKESPLKKIIICNELLAKSELLFNTKNIIYIPLRNWYNVSFQTILKSILNEIGMENNFIVITACGMASKSLIAELHKMKPNGIYLDFGSALDFLCTKRDSRGHNYTYQELFHLFHDILPDNWDDPKYDYIIEKAKHEMGKHLI